VTKTPARRHNERIERALHLLDHAERLAIFDDGRQRGDEHWTRRQPEKVRKGEEAAQAKMTEADVAELRLQAARGVPYRKLAAQYGVSPRTAWMAGTGRTWKHVPMPEAVTPEADPLTAHLERQAAEARRRLDAQRGV
jgi:hypothetical protein